MSILKKLSPFIIILVFSFFAFKPLLLQGFFPIHDKPQVARVYEMGRALNDGMFPVRWSKDLGFGYGYPVFNFYDPLFYYASGFFVFLGFDALWATKFLVIFSIVLAGFSMYVLANEFWGKEGGILASLLYVFAPYHAVDIFVRGDFAENLSYAFIPLVFYGFWKIYKEKKWKYVLISSLSFFAIIISHNLTAMMVSPFILVFIVYLIFWEKKEKKKLSAYLISSIVISGLLSAFYWLPAILEINYTNILSQVGGGANFRENFVCLPQLWTSPWGYGGSVEGCMDGLSFMIGKYHIILSFVLFILSSVFLFLKKYSKKFGKEKLLIIVFSFLGFVVSAFFTLEISKPVWEVVTPMEFIQYPWRFLIMIVFFSSFISGSLFWFIKSYIKNIQVCYLLALFAFLFVVLVSAKFFVPQSVMNVTSRDFTDTFSLEWKTSKISSEYMPKGFLKPKNPYEIPDIANLSTPDLRVNIVQRKTQELVLNINVYKQGFYILPVAYFPAWKAYLDQKSVRLSESSRGTLIYFPKGTHNLRLEFIQTPVEVFGDLLSFSGILALLIGIIYLRKNEG